MIAASPRATGQLPVTNPVLSLGYPVVLHAFTGPRCQDGPLQKSTEGLSPWRE